MHILVYATCKDMHVQEHGYKVRTWTGFTLSLIRVVSVGPIQR